MYFMYLGGIRMPVFPAEIKTRTKGNNKVVNMIDGGEVNILKDPHLDEYNFSLLLPNQLYSWASYRDKDGGYHEAAWYIEKLQSLLGKHFKMTITRNKTGTKSLLWKTVSQVSIEDMTIVEDAGINGTDIEVQMTLKKYRSYGPVKVSIVQSMESETVVTTPINTEKKKESTTYKVKDGDTLSSIAKKYFGDSSKQSVIYADNKDVIEKAAKDNGRKSSSKGKYIYPGTKLVINCG